MSALDILPGAQSSKVGKTEKSKPNISRRKSPNQRRYEDVRSRSVPKGHWHGVPTKGDAPEEPRKARWHTVPAVGNTARLRKMEGKTKKN